MTWGRRAKKLSLFWLAVWGILVFFWDSGAAQGFFEAPRCIKKALLVLGEGDLRPSSLAEPEMMGRLLLSSFTDDIEICSLEEYLPEKSRSKDFTLFMAPARRDYLVSLPQKGCPFMWIGPGLPQPNPLEGLVSYDSREQCPFDHLLYKGMQSFVGTKETLPSVEILRSKDMTVYAYATNLQKKYPYVFGRSSRQEWYVCTNPYWGKHLIPLLGVLTVFFKDFNDLPLRLFVRLEGVTPFTSPEQLRQIGEWLWKRKILFGIAYHPRSKEYRGEREILLKDAPRLVEVLNDLAQKGALLILVHRFDSSADGKEHFSEGLREVLGLSCRAGVCPSALQMENYALPPACLEVVSRFFPLLFGRIQVSHADPRGTFMVPFPSTIESMDYFPETLGYVRKEDPQGSALEIIGKARDLSLIRGSVGSFGYAPEFGLELLDFIVRSLEHLGYAAAEEREVYPKLADPGKGDVREKGGNIQPWVSSLVALFIILGLFSALLGGVFYFRASRRRKKRLFR